MKESAKLQKSRICHHLVSSRDESSKCTNTKKTGRDVSVIDVCYFARVVIKPYSLFKFKIFKLFLYVYFLWFSYRLNYIISENITTELHCYSMGSIIIDIMIIICSHFSTMAVVLSFSCSC